MFKTQFYIEKVIFKVIGELKGLPVMMKLRNSMNF